MIVIPVKKNSRRCPGKNMADIHGRPMFEWVLEEATDVAIRVVVLTDDPAVREAALRVSGGTRVVDLPEHLTADGAGVPQVMEWFHAIERRPWYNVVQVTTPLADGADYYGAQCFSNAMGCNVATVCPDLENKTWRRNGACYVWRPFTAGGWMEGPTVAYGMPAERSIDVNTPEDLERVRAMWNR